MPTVFDYQAILYGAGYGDFGGSRGLTRDFAGVFAGVVREVRSMNRENPGAGPPRNG